VANCWETYDDRSAPEAVIEVNAAPTSHQHPSQKTLRIDIHRQPQIPTQQILVCVISRTTRSAQYPLGSPSALPPQRTNRSLPMKGNLAWLIGIPIPITIVLYLLDVF
jgi:hypothetical protein